MRTEIYSMHTNAGRVTQSQVIARVHQKWNLVGLKRLNQAGSPVQPNQYYSPVRVNWLKYLNKGNVSGSN